MENSLRNFVACFCKLYIWGRFGFDSKVLCKCKHVVRCVICTLIWNA